MSNKVVTESPWDVLKKTRKGTQIKIKKGENNTMSFFFTYRKKEYELFNFEQAKQGEGVMDWSEYKNRTDKM